jgi:hypothetical protein
MERNINSMAKNGRFFLACLAFVGMLYLARNSNVESTNKRIPEAHFKDGYNSDTSCVVVTAKSYLGVKETSYNSSPTIDLFLRFVGLAPGNYWCTAFVSYVFHKCGLKTMPITAWTPALVLNDKIIYSRNKGSFPDEARNMVAVWDSRNKGRPSHSAILADIVGVESVIIEGNYSNRVSQRILPNETFDKIMQYE